MFIDVSALASMVARESDSDQLAIRPARTSIRITSALSVWEAAVAVSRIVGLDIADASARHFGEPLLYKGDDFARTDIEAA